MTVAVIKQFYEEFTHRPQTSIEGKIIQKDRKTERQKDRKTERQKDRKTKNRKTERQKDRKTQAHKFQLKGKLCHFIDSKNIERERI